MQIMKNKYHLFIFGLAVIAAAACSKDEYGAPDRNKYIYDIPQTVLDNDVITGAYYNLFTSEVDSKKSAEEPMLGWYRTYDEGVMSQHIRWADEAGLDFFVFSWDGPSGNTLIDSFKSAREDGTQVKYVLKYDTRHLKLSNDEPLQSTAKYNAMLADFIDHTIGYIKEDTYYKIDGRPVVVISPANLSSSALLSIDFSLVVPKLKNDLKNFYGIDIWLIGEMGTGWVAPVNYSEHQVYSFDALTLTSWKTRSYDVFYGYFSFLDINWNNWKTTLSRRNVDFIPCIYPSYNDRKSSSGSYYYTFSEDGSTDDYINFCNVAKRNIGSSNIVLINSWNNWNDGANLEPSTLKGDNFLKETKLQFKK